MSAWLLAAMLFASGADLISTEYNLSHGFVEQNVLMENRTVRIATNLAIPVGLYLLTRNREPWKGFWLSKAQL